jgi:hypothetical protein
VITQWIILWWPAVVAVRLLATKGEQEPVAVLVDTDQERVYQ